MWRWGGECRDLFFNSLSGSVPSELGELTLLEFLYVHTALNRPTRVIEMWGVRMPHSA